MSFEGSTKLELIRKLHQAYKQRVDNLAGAKLGITTIEPKFWEISTEKRVTSTYTVSGYNCILGWRQVTGPQTFLDTGKFLIGVELLGVRVSVWGNATLYCFSDPVTNWAPADGAALPSGSNGFPNTEIHKILFAMIRAPSAILSGKNSYYIMSRPTSLVYFPPGPFYLIYRDVSGAGFSMAADGVFQIRFLFIDSPWSVL